MNRAALAIVSLAGGVATYWFIRPGIALFDWLQVTNSNVPVVGPLRIVIGNYLADGLWCVACYAMAGFLRRRCVSRIYSRVLLALPIGGEVAQAYAFVPGTFDWFDVSLYGALLWAFLLVEGNRMKNFRKHLLGGATIGALAFGLMASSSPPQRPAPPPPEYVTGLFTLQPRADEMFAKPSLSKTLASEKTLAVVLRVPASDEKVTAEQRQANNLLYNTVEKELAKSGYLVRDRALFSKVLDQGQLDYSKIGQLTETDLILELVRYDNDPYTATEYRDASGGVQTAGHVISFAGAAIEFKVVSVKENDFVASYTFRYAPCSGGCTHKFSETVATTWVFSSGTPANETIFRDFAARLVRQLRPRK